MSAPPILTIRDQIRADAYASGRDYVGTVPAADYLDFVAGTLRRWRMQGRGPRYQKVGGEVRYQLDDLDAWLAAQFIDGSGGGER